MSDLSLLETHDLMEQNENILNLSMEPRHLQDAENPFNLPSNIFCNVFRLSKDMVRHIIDVIRLKDTTPDNSGMPLERQVLITLLVYANGEYQQWPGGWECDPDATNNTVKVNRIIQRITMAVSNHMLHWVRFPVSTSQREDAKNAVLSSENPFPGAFGAMDGFHVRIKTPDVEAMSFWSAPNKFHSLNVQLICGPDMKVLYVNPRFPGSSHDNVIWQASTAHRNLSSSYDEGERDTWLLGDGNFALQPWLMTPVAPSLVEPLSPEERYNTAHAKALSAVDACIRALRGTWRILSLHKPIEFDPVTVANMVNVCCVFHNMRCVANAPPIMEAPNKKRKYRARKRRSDSSTENGQNVSFAESASGPPEPSRPKLFHQQLPSDVVFLDVEQNAAAEASRLEVELVHLMAAHQAAANRQAVPPRVLTNQAAAHNILANQGAVPNGRVFDEDANVGGRKKELYLARRIRAQLIANYFT